MSKNIDLDKTLRLKKFLEQHAHILNPAVRHDFIWHWMVKNGNPNGDPDTGGAPRQFDDGRLIATEACAKRMIRDYWETVLGVPLYISRAAKEEKKCLKDMSSLYPQPEQAIAHYADVRLFGAVYLAAGKKDKEDEGNPDAKNAQILGPVQIGIGKTDEPVTIHSMSIGRILQEDKSDGTFGTRTFVEEATLRHTGRYSGYIGSKMGVTANDMGALWEGIINGPGLRQSSMSGERKTVKLTITTYDDAYGFGTPKTISLTF